MTAPQGKLVAHGPYRWIRHPLDTAVSLAGLGCVLALGTVVAWLLWAVAGSDQYPCWVGDGALEQAPWPAEGGRRIVVSDSTVAELYGGLDFRQRDQDMGRVMPVMIRFLPDRALGTMSEAFELQAISLEFDMAMAGEMALRGIGQLDMPRYCEAYRAANDQGGRERQILLIRKIGYDLDKLVRWPMVNYLVRLLRGPAHAAGFGNLQEFLEAGLDAFRSLEDPAYFIETIYRREWDSMEKMFAGAERPFGF